MFNSSINESDQKSSSAQLNNMIKVKYKFSELISFLKKTLVVKLFLNKQKKMKISSYNGNWKKNIELKKEKILVLNNCLCWWNVGAEVCFKSWLNVRLWLQATRCKKGQPPRVLQIIQLVPRIKVYIFIVADTARTICFLRNVRCPFA